MTKVQKVDAPREDPTFIHFNSHVVIVEVDENKHDAYGRICENKQLVQLSQDLNHHRRAVQS